MAKASSSASFGHILKLKRMKRCVDTPRTNQVIMSAEFLHLPINKHKYSIRFLNRLQPVGNKNARSAFHQLLQRVLNQ